MAFYDDLDEKTVRFGRSLVRKTKGICKSIRLSRIIREEERKQDEIFRQMGEYYYQIHGGEADGQMKIWCDAVWNNKMMVIQYQGQKRLIKGVTYCPNCSREIPNNSKFCNHCGARIPVTPRIQAGQAEPFTAKICPHCGTRTMEEDVFCSNCGNRLEESDVRNENAENESANKSVNDNINDTTNNIINDGINNNAGNSEKTGIRFGKSLKNFVQSKVDARKVQDEADQKEVEQEFREEEQAAEQELLQEERLTEQEEWEEVQDLKETVQEEQMRNESTRTCSGCGTILEEEYKFCPKCGLKF